MSCHNKNIKHTLLISRPARWPDTCPFAKRSLTSAPTSSPQVTAWTHATTWFSPIRCARAILSRWEGRSNPGRSAGSSLIALKGRFPTTPVCAPQRCLPTSSLLCTMLMPLGERVVTLSSPWGWGKKRGQNKEWIVGESSSGGIQIISNS